MGDAPNQPYSQHQTHVRRPSSWMRDVANKFFPVLLELLGTIIGSCAARERYLSFLHSSTSCFVVPVMQISSRNINSTTFLFRFRGCVASFFLLGQISVI